MKYYIEGTINTSLDLKNTIKLLQNKHIKLTKCVKIAQKPKNKEVENDC